MATRSAQKAKILKENGIHVKGAEAEKARERFMQEEPENLRSKRAANKSKGRTQPRASPGAAEVSGTPAQKAKKEGGKAEKPKEAKEKKEKASDAAKRKGSAEAAKEAPEPRSAPEADPQQARPLFIPFQIGP